MNRTIAFSAVFLLAAWAAFAVPADITYTEGDATLKLKNGKQQDAQIGDKMNTGDTLKTGSDGLAELSQAGVTVKISSGTVFTLMERDVNGKTQTVMSTALGSIKYKYGKLSGSEPAIRTNGAIAGVRGTEFTVFAGADGSSLITVDSGEVDVQSGGKTVQLTAAQGTEVPLGKPPGDPIPIKSDQIDYSKWNQDKLDSMLADPVGTMATLQDALDNYARDVADYYGQYLVSKKQLDEVVKTAAQIFKEKGQDEATKYQQEFYYPLTHQAGALVLNYRYNALAALSLRTYVTGRMYLALKARYILNPDDPVWTDFLGRYNAFLSTFEQSISPQLVDADI